MTRRVYFVAHGGTVQGVGFRYFTKGKAEEYGITGWCRNTHDNKVEGEAQGEEASLSKFLKHVDDGPRHAKVVQFTKEDRDVVEGLDPTNLGELNRVGKYPVKYFCDLCKGREGDDFVMLRSSPSLQRH